MSGSNVPRPSFTDTGVLVPSESAIHAGFWADFQAALGGRLNQSEATPQGQLVASLTALMGASNDLFMQYVNWIDPARTEGRMQDAIARIYFLTRIAGTPTTVTCTLTGAAGMVIGQGALAQATDGTIYESLSAVTLDAGGIGTAQFSAIDAGPIPLPAGSLSRIYRVVPGWDTITNPADGVPGRYTETPAEFEARRSASVAANSEGMIPSIRGAILKVDGVSDAYVTENATGAPLVIGGVTLAPHSLYAAVQGGSDDDVARAIWSRKPPGCGYTGTTTVTVTDDAPGYAPPFPAYDVTFQRPTPLPISFFISIANNGHVPSDAQAQIRNAVMAAFTGADGGIPARIGSTIFALRFACTIQALGSWAQLLSIAIGSGGTPGAEVIANIDQYPTLAAGSISVTLV
jgi:uncharacterized phage protein gp47/JayE